MDLADDAIISVDFNGLILLFNHGAQRMFGYSAREAFMLPIQLLLPGDLTRVHNSAVMSSMGSRCELMARRKDGSQFPAEVSISKAGSEGGGSLKAPQFSIILRDVTERALSEERLRASIREKEVLLKEVHHRVKNSLQVVSSLLGLQARLISDCGAKKQFEDSQHRIQSMALLHETLYRSNSLDKLDFSEYLRRLTEQIFRSHRTSQRVRLHIDLEQVPLHMDVAVPCGLIVTELISNALKYAFPCARQGEVRLELHRIDRDGAVLTVADNGVGLPPDVDWVNARTLGLRLVRALAQQLRATIKLEGSAGTRFRIYFPRTEAMAPRSAESEFSDV